jgi:hypothetical protein
MSQCDEPFSRSQLAEVAMEDAVVVASRRPQKTLAEEFGLWATQRAITLGRVPHNASCEWWIGHSQDGSRGSSRQQEFDAFLDLRHPGVLLGCL